MPRAARPSTKSSRSITVRQPAGHSVATWLYAPGLGELLRADWRDRAPALARLLERGRSLEPPAALVDLADPAAPSAAYARLADCGDAGDAHWLRADPAVLQADLTRVHLLAVGQVELSAEQERLLVDDLAGLFSGLGLELSRGGPGRWYVRSPDPIAAGFTSPDRALGRPLEDQLPAGAGAGFWHRLQSECQMLLHEHPVNRDRAAAGYPPVTSLWFWGAGALPHPGPVPFTRACARSAAVSGWCLHHDVARVADPAQAAANGPGLVEWRADRGSARAENLARLETDLSHAAAAGGCPGISDGAAAAALLGLDRWCAWRRGVARFVDDAG